MKIRKTLIITLVALLATGAARTQDAVSDVEDPSEVLKIAALEALLDLGWVDADMDGQRRLFRLTEAGREQREAAAETLAAEGIDAFLQKRPPNWEQ
mgnify:CR=1 FL=1